MKAAACGTWLGDFFTAWMVGSFITGCIYSVWHSICNMVHSLCSMY